jgi:hypothetical protein
MPAPKYDWNRIDALKETGMSWAEIALSVGFLGDPKALCTMHSNRKRRKERMGESDITIQPPAGGNFVQEKAVSGAELEALTSLEDLASFFHLPDDWEAVRCWVRGGAWDRQEKGGVLGVGKSFRISAEFARKVEHRVAQAEAEILQLYEDAQVHAPPYEPVPRAALDGDPVCAVVNVYDPHLGMLAWGPEVGGVNYDLDIAIRDYEAANEDLLSMARLYPVEEIVLVVGHDLTHADMVGPNESGAMTQRGTAQDMDARLNKIFTETRRVLVRTADKARLIAPVRMEFVLGNHDPGQTYRLGEALYCWYHNDDEVQVSFSPNKRTFYRYGANAFMFTHGEEFKRQRDSLPLIFSQECPAKDWVESTHREVLTGHFHKAMAGRYVPTHDLDENRGIRTRALPGLTATDKWHHDSGYKHQRAATLICYKKSGGVRGLHEFEL